MKNIHESEKGRRNFPVKLNQILLIFHDDIFLFTQPITTRFYRKSSYSATAHMAQKERKKKIQNGYKIYGPLAIILYFSKLFYDKYKVST